MPHFHRAIIKLLFSVVILLSISQQPFAQDKRSGEIGISLGGSYYLGEYNKTPFIETKIAAAAFYRHTFHTRFALTGNISYGKLSGKVENSDYIAKNTAPATFKNTFYELAPVVEFNFIPYLPGKPKKYYFTPYVFAGAGVTYYPGGTTKIFMNIPFGIGAKYSINENFNFGLFAGMRKTFKDDLDYNYNPPPSPDIEEKQWGYAANKDWYSIFGVSLSYKIKYRVKCPAFD